VARKGGDRQEWGVVAAAQGPRADLYHDFDSIFFAIFFFVFFVRGGDGAIAAVGGRWHLSCARATADAIVFFVAVLQKGDVAMMVRD
jgi:hypothetical protein